ncbi:MAG TPA: hypothetical protein VGE35_03950 [Candidatus Paceibacterota bacterium]
MSKNATIGVVIAIVVILVGAAVIYQSRQDVVEPMTSETSSSETTGTLVTGSNGATGSTGSSAVGTVKPATGTSTPTTSPAVSVGTPGYTDYVMKAGESINIAGYTATLTSIGASDVSVKLVKGPTTSNQTYKLNTPSTGYGFTGEVRKIDTASKSVTFRVTILP